MLEKQLEAKIVKFCRDRGYYCRKLSSPAHMGVPDRLICHGGKALFLELKRPGNTPTALQLREMDLLTAAGMRATWTNNYQSAVEIIEDHFA